MKRFLSFFALVFSLVTLFLPESKAQFVVSAEFRPRLEFRDGYANLLDSTQLPYLTILGRNRLVFDYRNDKFMARFNFQHAYVFGENNYASDTITRNTLNIYEGWFRYSFTKMFAVKIGRMELVYDDARLLGNSNWNPKGASHDVVLLQWESAKVGYHGDFGFAINNTAPAGSYLNSYTLKNYKYMGFFYEQVKLFKEHLVISLIDIVDAFQKPVKQRYDTLYVTNSSHDTIGTTVIPYGNTKSDSSMIYARCTFGGTVTFTLNNLKVFGAGYYQMGHFNDGREISAGMAGGYASYKVAKPLTLLAGYEWLSGNNFSDVSGLKTKTTSFSTLYGTNHAFYGYMDLFSKQVSSGNSAGLTDLYGRATLNLKDKVSIEATYRWFNLQNGYLYSKPSKTNPGYTEVSRNLGSEVDLMCIYKPVQNLELSAAYCFFLPTATMKSFSGVKGDPRFAQYAYIMITYKPTFFNSEKH